MDEEIAIIDYGSQYTQLIAKNLRQLKLFCRIYLPHQLETLYQQDTTIRGIILSGGPHSVNDPNSPKFDFDRYRFTPILGICYGSQLIAHHFEGVVESLESTSTIKSEYGTAILDDVTPEGFEHFLFHGIDSFPLNVIMSHRDHVVSCRHAIPLAATDKNGLAAFKIQDKEIYGLQFHPEVNDSQDGFIMLHNFGYICQMGFKWTPDNILKTIIGKIRLQVFDDLSKAEKKNDTPRVAMAVSGGVDSTVAGRVIQQVVGETNFYPILVDTGFMRWGEIDQIVENFRDINFVNLRVINARKLFMRHLKGVSDPEKKRKIIGGLFIKIFEQEVNQIKKELNRNNRWGFHKKKVITYLGQGTIYPDVIESAKENTIKSHHNVGGLPKRMKLTLVEPLRMLFKDDVRQLGQLLDIPDIILNRQPFPGPGLAIRIIGPIATNSLYILKRADHLVSRWLTQNSQHADCWQSATVLLSEVNSVGVQGDSRAYQNVLVFRAVNSVNGMTATVHDIPVKILEALASYICSSVPEIGRMVYDITPKPPATIEWE